MRSIRDNPLRARAVGIPVNRRLVVIYTLAAAYAGVAGGLLAQTTQFVSLDVLAFHRSADITLVLVIGGVGYLYGGLIGAMVFKLLQDYLSNITPQYWLFWIGLILVLLVLTDRERMTDTAAARSGPWTLSRAYAMFPRLKERRSNLGNQLSGGEQQMQSIARALVLNPKLMLLDEPKGLALIIIEELLAALKRIIREEGMSAIAVEQHAQKILGVIDSAVILDRGTVVHASSSRALIDDPTALEQHLGTTAKKKSGRTLSGPSNVGEGAIRSSR